MAAVCCPLSSCDEHAQVFNRVYRVARKTHTCEECREPIEPGTRYEHVTMLFDGQWSGFRTCMLCAEIGDHFNCGGRTVGALWEELESNFYPYMKCGGPCMEGLSVAAKIRLVDARMEWLLGETEIDDSAWEDFATKKNYQRPRPNPYALSTVLAEAEREQHERDRYFAERDREVAWFWSRH